MSAPARTAMSVIAEAFAPLEGRRILDVGCGRGALARSLGRKGVRVTGIDAADEKVEAARAAAPDSEFRVADGAALPFGDAAFDGVVFLNSLHHLAGRAGMTAALAEAARVAGPGRAVVVIEPLAEGSFFEAVRSIEDETEVRADAQAAITAVLDRHLFDLVGDETFERVERFDGVEAFVAMVVAGDRSREAAVAAGRDEIDRAFHHHAMRDEAGAFTFVQPLRGQTLRVRS